MKCNILKTSILILTSVLFNACGEGGGTVDPNSSTETSTIPCELNTSWGSCGEPELIFSSNETANPLGVYGDNVYLGNKKIVGSWQLYGIDENGSKSDLSIFTQHYFRFNNDGTGMFNSARVEVPILYGVNSASHSFIISTDHAYNLPTIYSMYSYKDSCYLVIKQDANHFADQTLFYLCQGWDYLE